MAKYFVVVHIDVQEQAAKKALNTPGGDELLAQIGGGKQGVPFFAFLDPSGGLMANSIAPPGNGGKGGNVGHPYKPYEVDYFMAVLSKVAPAMSADERATIETWLRSQK